MTFLFVCILALIGALYVDQGMDVCAAFCDALFFTRIKVCDVGYGYVCKCDLCVYD